MEVNELTLIEYANTMKDNMVDITTTAELNIDIWPYVDLLVKGDVVSQYVYDNQFVELVFRNSLGTYEHILLPTVNENVFIVIVVDLEATKVKGHYKLDLRKKSDSETLEAN